METLAHAEVDTTDSVDNGLTWLIGRQQPDGGWTGGLYPFPVTESFEGLTSPQHVYATAQVLSTVSGHVLSDLRHGGHAPGVPLYRTVVEDMARFGAWP